MTSQIVEEQIKIMENKLIEAGVAVSGNGVSLDKVTFVGTNIDASDFLRSFASTLIDRVSKDVKKMRLKHKDYERHVHIYTNEGTGKCHICQMSWKESSVQGTYNQALSDVYTKLQEMR